MSEGCYRPLKMFFEDTGDPPGAPDVVGGIPEGGKIAPLAGVPCAFIPDDAPEEMFEIANELYQKSR